MTGNDDEDGDGTARPPTMFDVFQETGEQAVEQQRKFLRGLFGAGSGMDVTGLGAMTNTATFKTRVQSGGRISIPDAEREALDIEEGDIVQTVVIPVKRDRGD
jgi:hypothetical protein